MTAELEDQGIAQGEGERIAGIYQKTLNKRALALVALAAGIILLTAVAVTLGSAGLTVSEVYLAILSRFFPGSVEVDQLHATIIWDLRLHRVIFAVLAGFGLAIAGAMMQGVLRNPLASPFTLGIASAASFGAALAIMFIPTYLKGDLVIVICAFLASLLAAAAIYGLSRYRGMSAESMVLAGIILMYFFGAVTSFLQYTGSTEQLQAVVFWMFGSLQRTSWLKCGIVAVVLGACVPYVILRHGISTSWPWATRWRRASASGWIGRGQSTCSSLRSSPHRSSALPGPSASSGWSHPTSPALHLAVTTATCWWHRE